jgi:hypothetical protein
MKNLMSILTLTMLSTGANAQISYDYIETGYEKVTIDNFELSGDNNILIFGDVDGDGLVFEGSFSFGENYFAYADFDFSSLDLASFDLGNNQFVDPVIDLNTQVLGVGYHSDGGRQFVAKAAFLRREFDSDFFKVATLGYVVELGGRGLINDDFEWEANLDYTDPDANDGPSGKLGVSTSLRYHFGNNFSTDFSASTADDGVTYGLNFRFNFSRQ